MANTVVRTPLLPFPLYPNTPAMLELSQAAARPPVHYPQQAVQAPVYYQAYRPDTVQIQVRPTAPFPTQPVQPVQYLPHYDLPQNLIKETTPKTYREKLAASAQKFAEHDREQFKGYGKMLGGAAKTTVYAPFGALEAAGRTAIAITGGNVSYDHNSPLHEMGDGLNRMGEGTGQVLSATGGKIVAMADTLAYAPLAALEVTARGAGMVVGGAVKGVSESFLGKEFSAGYQQVMPSRN